ncbi:TPA: hypothetical protein ACW0T4_003815 [Morganella morganii]
MNERDWADWIAIGASVLSSLGIIVSVVIYLCQKSSENKKQKEIDMKLFHFIEIKGLDLVSKLDKVLHLVENENEYMHIRIENGRICYNEILEDQNIAYCKIDLRISNKNDFLDRHGVQASLDLFKFIIEIDSLSEMFFYKTSCYIKYGIELFGHYIPEISDNFQSDAEKDLLINFLNETKYKIKLNIDRFSIM